MGINFSMGEKLWGGKNKNEVAIENLRLKNAENENKINNLNKIVVNLKEKEKKFDTEVKLFICLKIESLVKKFENLDIKVTELTESVKSNKLELKGLESKIEKLHQTFKNACTTYDSNIIRLTTSTNRNEIRSFHFERDLEKTKKALFDLNEFVERAFSNDSEEEIENESNDEIDH